jgi:hypothetical protein
MYTIQLSATEIMGDWHIVFRLLDDAETPDHALLAQGSDTLPKTDMECHLDDTTALLSALTRYIALVTESDWGASTVRVVKR